MKIITESQCTNFSKPNHLENPERISRTVDYLRSQEDMEFVWAAPTSVDDAVLLRAHDSSLLQRLEEPVDFDNDTPHFPSIGQFARRGAGGAIAALDAACAGEGSFCLMRPPGHHATRFSAMGFCYLNSIAIAAMEAQSRRFKNVAVFDFDVHHGNGTEEIFLDLPGLVFASVHQTGYPFTGTAHRGGNCLNYPVKVKEARETYRAAWAQALEDICRFKPDMLAISAGFDAYHADPLSEQKLEIEDYHWLGLKLRALGLPMFGILEGGYSPMLPQLVTAYLRGLEGKPLQTSVATPSASPL